MGKCTGVDVDMYYCIDTNLDKVNCSLQQNVIVFAGSPTAVTTIGVVPSSASSSRTKISFSSSASSRESTTGTGMNGSPTGDAAIQTSQNSTPTTTITSEKHSEEKKSSAIPIALGVAIPVVVIIAAVLGFFFWRKHKKSKAGLLATAPVEVHADSKHSAYLGYEGQQVGPLPYEHYHATGTSSSELGNSQVIGELSAEARHEMDGDSNFISSPSKAR
jgi:hypothetical protein